MDNFMDEIVQKFTPQEMIRANAAADAAEIESLEKQLTLFKEQMEKYDDCLQEMRQVNLKNIETAQDVQQLADKMGQHLGKTAGEVEAASVSKIKETSDLSMAGIQKAIDESLAKIAEIKEHADNTQQIAEMVNELQDKTENVIKNLEDFLHTDNVKVYRNVQASMIEELDRRTGELKEELQKTQKKSGILFPLVLITMILSALNLIVAVLGLLGILLLFRAMQIMEICTANACIHKDI